MTTHPRAPDPEHLNWPFFDDGHRAYARELQAWCETVLPTLERGHGAEADGDEAAHALVKQLVPALGRAGLLRACVSAAHGGAREQVDVRMLAIARETLASASGLADFALAMQGLGSVPVSLFGNAAQQRALLPAVARGEAITAFALSEPDAGSDAAAMSA
ncbi:MAG TPA: acyl-CoA dehydrogenase family protein, partial [Burkholderiaceae bacterium]|nr:acyl-CoA dehydrogenase family protein [Burkholderiaceae bacterium]